MSARAGVEAWLWLPAFLLLSIAPQFYFGSEGALATVRFQFDLLFPVFAAWLAWRYGRAAISVLAVAALFNVVWWQYSFDNHEGFRADASYGIGVELLLLSFALATFTARPKQQAPPPRFNLVLAVVFGLLFEVAAIWLRLGAIDAIASGDWGELRADLYLDPSLLVAVIALIATASRRVSLATALVAALLAAITGAILKAAVPPPPWWLQESCAGTALACLRWQGATPMIGLAAAGASCAGALLSRIWRSDGKALSGLLIVLAAIAALTLAFGTALEYWIVSAAKYALRLAHLATAPEPENLYLYYGVSYTMECILAAAAFSAGRLWGDRALLLAPIIIAAAMLFCYSLMALLPPDTALQVSIFDKLVELGGIVVLVWSFAWFGAVFDNDRFEQTSALRPEFA